MSAYAELAVTTNFSFLRGASHPGEMVATADALKLAAIGIADRNSFAGVVRAYDEWKKRKSIKLLVGTRLVTVDGFEVLTYPTDRQAYGRLCRLLTKANLKAKKGECHLTFEQILDASEGQIFIALPPEELSHAFTARLSALVHAAPGRAFLAGVHYHRGDEPRRLGLLAEFGERHGAPLVAVNDVHYHAPERRPLLDVVTCIREKCTFSQAGLRLAVNAERHLKAPSEMARLFKNFPDAVARTVDIANACTFSLGQLKYEYPDEPVPPGKTAQQHLENLTWAGAAERYPQDRFPNGVPTDVKARLNEELALIAKLDYARYFLTVHDVVAYARKVKNILCQGRGSAANSAVCFCLGITEVNPNESKLLFARFISANRNEPPDIDVDFEHERREEVIQYIYRRYGRHRAAICSTVVHYRSRRAIREVGKVLGLTEDITAALAKTVWGTGDELPDDHVRQAGLDPKNPAIRQAVELADALTGFPRHLSQHVGGFVLTREPLDQTVPIGNAAMDERTFIEWDKDDIDTLGLMKVDVLALGMLSCLKRGLDLLQQHYGVDYSLASIPKDGTDDAPAVYDMLSRADSIGVFQVESRAQMSMLPRLKPQCFYDLVIEVAIVRPGPIQGDMVHPYLRRRDRIDPEHYPSPDPAQGPADELKNVLKRTLGVPLFQEQAMQIAIDAAKFTPDEADGLRRAMATFRHNGTVHNLRRSSSSTAWCAAAMSALLPNVVSSRSRVSANTASRKATPRASRSWSMPRPGSNAAIPTCSAPPSSTANRWVFISRPSWCAMRGRTASKFWPPTSISALGIALSNRPPPYPPPQAGEEKEGTSPYVSVSASSAGLRKRSWKNSSPRAATVLPRSSGSRPSPACRASPSSGWRKPTRSARLGSTAAPHCGRRAAST